MKYALTCIWTAVLFSGALQVRAQVPGQPANTPKRGQELTVTGCLSMDNGGIKGASANYLFTDQKSGMKMTVTGSADLESHAANHTVKLTGTETQRNGRAMFEATKVEDLGSTCQAPSGK